MFRACVALVGLLAVSASVSAGQGGSAATRRAASTKLAKDATCVSALGAGVKTNRSFCDVIIANTPARSVAMAIPPHTGAATLLFDLHNRFSAPAGPTDPAQAFQRHTVVVGVIRPTGEVIDRAAVVGEFRTVQDLFDRITGTGPAGVKAVAPGPAQAVRVTIPAGVQAIGIVGIRQDIDTRTAHAAFTTPGRPVAIVSNMRIEYVPGRQ
ncbi:MAG TPA: hypothetical protein VLT86_07545 [Vicinamibacterales bacterium]|nr:hypothetical protein [Vicinamibacterales bacterium]